MKILQYTIWFVADDGCYETQPMDQFDAIKKLKAMRDHGIPSISIPSKKSKEDK